MPSSYKKATRASPGARLAAEDWVNAAVRTMLRSGVDGVRVERLAKDLRVTKGSFYWHFRDRAALLDAVLEHWVQITVNFNRMLISEEPDAARRLLRFLLLPEQFKAAVPPADFDLAVRGWARRSARVRVATQRVDALRHGIVLQTFHELGAAGEKAQALSRICAAVAHRLWVMQTLSLRARHSIIAESYAMLMQAVRQRKRRLPRR